MAAPLLELEGVSKAFGGLRVIDGLDLVVERAGGRERHRPERRRQDDALQPHHRSLPAGRRRDPPRRAQPRRHAAAQDHAARNRAHVPDAAALPEHVRQGERDGRPVRPDEGRAAPLDSADPRDAARGEGDPQAGRGEAQLLRQAAHGLPLGPARVLPLLREPAPARDRARHGDRAADPPPGRAGCRA